MLLPAIALSLLGPCFPGVTPEAGVSERGGALRPALSGVVQSVDSEDGRFTVHWTNEGQDAPDPRDDDGNLVPDMVDRVVDALVVAADFYEDQGFRAVRADQGGGGTAGLDVYVREIDAFGYSHVDPTTEGASCWMELAPDLDALGEGTAESVAAHELHHCVQYAYTTQAHSWIYEATSTFEQYLLFEGPALELALGVLWNQRLRGSDRALSALGDRFEYAGFVFVKFWTEASAVDPGRRVELWEQLSETPSWEEAVELESQRVWARSFDDTFLELSTWKAFACARSDGQHFGEETHPCVLPEVSVELQSLPGEGGDFSIDHSSTRYTALFGELMAAGDTRPVELLCEKTQGEGSLRLVALDAWGEAGEAADVETSSGEGFTLRLSSALHPQGAVLLVSTSVGDEPLRLSCGLERVQPEQPPESGGCSCRSEGRGTSDRSRGESWVLGGVVLLALGLRGRRRTSPRAVAC